MAAFVLVFNTPGQKKGQRLTSVNEKKEPHLPAHAAQFQG